MASLDDVMPTSSTAPAPSRCPPLFLHGWAKPFAARHPDVEQFLVGEDPGVVDEWLGDDGRPVYTAAGATTTIHGPASFATWFAPGAPDVGTGGGREPVTLHLERQGDEARYASGRFRPLAAPSVGQDRRNFSVELHGTFPASATEIVAGGDDDLWVFVDGRLVLDQGGLHGIREEIVRLEAPDPGVVTRTLDLFFAERQTSGSALVIAVRGVACPR